MVDTTITHQLRTTLAKSVKDQNVNIDMLGISGDTMKLKKHIGSRNTLQYLSKE